MASPFGYQEITSGNSIYYAVVAIVFAGLACMRGLWGLMAEQLLLAEVLPETDRGTHDYIELRDEFFFSRDDIVGPCRWRYTVTATEYLQIGEKVPPST